MMSIELKRDFQREDLWWTLERDNSWSCAEVFKISANGNPIVAKDSITWNILQFNQRFDESHGLAENSIRAQFTRTHIAHIRVPIGYAQAYQDEFNAEFK